MWANISSDAEVNGGDYETDKKKLPIPKISWAYTNFRDNLSQNQQVFLWKFRNFSYRKVSLKTIKNTKTNIRFPGPGN